MLQIKNISKQYKTGDLVQNALSDVSLNLRDNEFVSILGPSGSGKTTLLNIIGGLDRYDSGNLIINNVSTKRYKSRDWDSYRNHTIGFVFQSYNLIPHQTVLSNVELALTIGGISKRERKKRALAALREVGLRDHAHKKPNQMSGGQMQRVAIARALVNNPDILLADEPTGALDSETSVQVMELLKEVAKDRLVIMVTHNPEIAERYSTRIVKLKDGKIIDDSNPFVPDVSQMLPPKHKNLGKASMSILTALSLSFNNLLTKKGRTFITAFAGSIGIIGIALILSLSTGFQNYIDKIQEDTLTSYPLTITAETADTTSMLLSMVSDMEGENDKEGYVRERQNITTMFSKIGKNDLTSFKEYIEDNKEELDKSVALTRYMYSVTPMIYTKNKDEKIIQLNPSTLLTSVAGGSMESMNTMGMSMGASVFNEMIDNQDLIRSEYQVLAGKWPEKYNEVVLVLPEKNGMPDLLVYCLGLRDSKELDEMISKIMDGEKVEKTNEPLEFSYEDLLNLPLKLVNPTDTYKYNEKYKIYESMTEDEQFIKNVYENSIDLKISAVVSPNENYKLSTLTPGIAYLKDLTEYVIETAEKSEIAKKQLENKDINVFSNKRFDDESKEAGLNFEDMISIDTEMLSSAFGMKVSEEYITKITSGYMEQIAAVITTDTTKAQTAFSENLISITTDMLNDYILKNEQAGVTVIKLADVDKIVDDFMKTDTTKAKLAALEKTYIIPTTIFADTYSKMINGFLKAYVGMMGMGQEEPSAFITKDAVTGLVTAFVTQEEIVAASNIFAAQMSEAIMKTSVMTKVGELTGKLMETIATSFNVDQNKIASAFKFELNEDELIRLFKTMTASSSVETAETNLLKLGYQDINKPTSISFYFNDFEAKERFLEVIDKYNEKMEEEDDEKVIKYTDITGILMSSVKTIVDSVSYVLIAFVSISLVVSSIMIGIITYISVLERTKEIGVLRAIGASKKNISSIFNAETFIVGLLSGLIGKGTSIILLNPINYVIHSVTENKDIIALLPKEGAIVLVILSVILTLIGGLIPSRAAAKKDPVLALRSE